MEAARAAHRWRNTSVAIAALTGVLAIAWKLHDRSKTSTPALQYETERTDRGSIRAKVTATGTVNPIVQVQVGTQVSGRIESLGADFNSAVEPGQMVAQIDPRLFRAAVELATANLQAAHASVHKASAALADVRRIAARDHDMLAQNLIAKSTVDTADTAVATATADLETATSAEAQARAQLDSAKLDLDYTTIRSPIRGTVITRNVDVGQTVAASFASPTLFLVGEDLAKMEVDTNIAEADVGALAPGMTATFTVDAFSSELFRGTIRQVRSSPQVVQNVVTYNAVIDVPNPKLQLKPGMTANVEIVYAERAETVRVPNAAIRFRAPAELATTAPSTPLGKKLVWVMRGGEPKPVVFEPGVSDGTFTEVRSGLDAGELVITEVTSTHGHATGRML
ncbi:MAG: efflux RND transporter periplasmic adaptor subunit [Kofleriaceae bacterium]